MNRHRDNVHCDGSRAVGMTDRPKMGLWQKVERKLAGLPKAKGHRR